MLAGGHLVARRGDPLGQVGVEQARARAFVRAAAALIAPSMRITATGTRCPETGKFSTALLVSEPQSSC